MTTIDSIKHVGAHLECLGNQIRYRAATAVYRLPQQAREYLRNGERVHDATGGEIGFAISPFATSLDIDLDPFAIGTSTPATNAPIITVSVAMTADGWALSGQVTPQATIHNYGMRIFPRDDRGLLFAERTAFPGNLGTLAAGTAVSFESENVDCRFTEHLLFDSWITGPR